MNLLDILNKTSDYFQRKGIPNYRLDAQLLLGHVLNLDRIELYLNYDRPLTESELSNCREVVRRRASREPLQHIIGSVEFRNISLKTDSRALIPRKETELIVDILRPFVESLTTRHPSESIHIFDLGVGAGPILLSLIKEFQQTSNPSNSTELNAQKSLTFYGSDIARDAIDLTIENALLNDLELNPDNLFLGDGISAIPKSLPIHLIVSNPPYIGFEEKQTLQPEVRDYDPDTALYGGQKGVEFSITLLNEAYAKIETDGALIIEFGIGQGSQLSAFAKEVGWQNIQIHPDYSGVERFLSLKKPK